MTGWPPLKPFWLIPSRCGICWQSILDRASVCNLPCPRDRLRATLWSAASGECCQQTFVNHKSIFLQFHIRPQILHPCRVQVDLIQQKEQDQGESSSLGHIQAHTSNPL
jgi:hypothetical protein